MCGYQRKCPYCVRASAFMPLLPATAGVPYGFLTVTNVELQTPIRELKMLIRELQTPIRELQTPIRELQTLIRELQTLIRELQTPIRELHITRWKPQKADVY